MKIRYILLSVFLSFGIVKGHAQKSYAAYCAAFYNVENLFDTEDDLDNPGDDDYLPDGANSWTPAKYQRKLDNIAKVISKLGTDFCPAGPAVVGLAEVENKRVIDDLVKNKQIAHRGYEVVHYDSPDRRGIDVGLIYNPDLFRVTNTEAVPYNLPGRPSFVTRDHLVVSGVLAGEPVHVIVAHWPSRYGGAKSSALREHAASIVVNIVDSLNQINPDSKVIFMGDLNDDPDDISCRVVLNAKKKQEQVKPGGLYNTMWKFYDQGIGSLAYQGRWNLFDQIIVSHGLLGDDTSSLKFWKAEIFNKDFLVRQEGRRKGYPWRTFDGSSFIDGYSDHFPTLIYLIKEI